MTSLVAKYQPARIQDFIGIAEPKAALAAVARQPYASSFLLLGPSGVGKTTISQAFAEAVKGEVHHIPSAKCDKESVDAVTEKCWYRPMFGAVHVVIVDEADSMSRPAQDAWLSKLDSTAMPPDCIFIFTANGTEKLHPRFLSRCRILEFASPTAEEIAAFLERVWRAESSADVPDLAVIAAKCSGNVRAALMDLELKMLVAVEPVKRTWFETVRDSQPKAPPKMKRILVKRDEKWVHEFVEVSA